MLPGTAAGSSGIVTVEVVIGYATSAPSFSMMSAKGDTMRPGYYRDHDTWLYATSAGGLYCVHEPGEAEPTWRAIGLPLGDDAERKTPDDVDLAVFERARLAYGIPE